jgi:hypothetical protein
MPKSNRNLLLQAKSQCVRQCFRVSAMLLLGSTVFSGALLASDSQDSELLQLINQLRAEVQSLREEVSELRGQREPQMGAPSVQRPVAIDPVAERATVAAAPTPAPVPKKPTMSFYGYVKADAFYDSATTSHQEIPFWASGPIDGGSELDFTARQTRFGFNLEMPETYAGGKLTGKLEFDFYGFIPSQGDVAANHGYQLRSRHLFVKWSNPRWDFLAGKTDEAYILEFPDTLNFSTYNFQGQLGLRRMQVQLAHKADLGEGRGLRTTIALDEPLGAVHGGDLDGNRVDDGTDSSFPGMVVRSVYSTPMFGRTANFGVAGYYAREVIWNQRFDSEALIIGGSIPLGEKLTLKGSVWTGSNLDNAWGGIGQGINVVTRRAIASTGGWAQLRFQPDPKVWFNLGFSTDNPRDADLNPGQRSNNTTYLLNGYYQIFKPLRVGMEYLHVRTDYLDRETMENNRVMSSLIYTF